MPNVVELATGRERARGGVVGWTEGNARLQCATVQFGHRLVVHLVVEELGKTGWDWHVWVQAGWTWARYGLAETAENAREQAEWALAGLMRSDADGNAPFCPNCRFALLPQRSA